MAFAVASGLGGMTISPAFADDNDNRATHAQGGFQDDRDRNDSRDQRGDRNEGRDSYREAQPVYEDPYRYSQPVYQPAPAYYYPEQRPGVTIQSPGIDVTIPINVR